jgi:hypothetical protein
MSDLKSVKTFNLQRGEKYIMRDWKRAELLSVKFLGAGIKGSFLETTPSVKTMTPEQSFFFEMNGVEFNAYNVDGCLCIDRDIKHRITFYAADSASGAVNAVKAPVKEVIVPKAQQTKVRATPVAREPIQFTGSLRIPEKPNTIAYYAARFNANVRQENLDILVKQFSGVVVKASPLTELAFLPIADDQAREFFQTVCKLGGLVEEHRVLEVIKG